MNGGYSYQFESFICDSFAYLYNLSASFVALGENVNFALNIPSVRRCSYKCILLIKLRPVFNVQKGLITVTHCHEQKILEKKSLNSELDVSWIVPPDASSLTRNPVAGVEGKGSSSQIYKSQKYAYLFCEIQLLAYWIWVSFMLSPSMHCGW